VHNSGNKILNYLGLSRKTKFRVAGLSNSGASVIYLLSSDFCSLSSGYLVAGRGYFDCGFEISDFGLERDGQQVAEGAYI
jgi:hypothetical protein